MSKKHSLFILYSAFTVFLLVMSFLSLRTYFLQGVPKVLSATTEVPSEELFWKSFLSSNPNYLPGYIELAKIQIENGQLDEANNILIKAEKIDPNSSVVRTLKDILFE